MNVLAVVTSITPLTVTLDGDTDPVPARNYSLSLSEEDRVTVELTTPFAPIIRSVLS